MSLCCRTASILLGVLLGCDHVHGQSAAVVEAGFVFESAPFLQCHASTIAETPAGVLVSAWFGGTREKHPDVGIWVSRREKDQWSAPVEVATGVQYRRVDGTLHRHPCWNPVLFQPSAGPLMLFYKVGPHPEAWWGMLTTSTDEGVTWSVPRRLPEGILGPIKNKPVELSDGAMLCPSSTEQDGWRVHFEISRDLGESWERSEPVNDGQEIHAIQPSVLTLPANRLLAVGRTKNDRVFVTKSADGKTWEPMSLGSLPNPNSGTDAVTLEDGRHLLVYNHVPGEPGKWGGKRSPLNVAIADEHVRQWQAALVLEDEAGAEFSYPAIIQTRDGSVHVVYTWKRQRIKHVVIDPAQLRPMPFQDGVWPD